MSEKSWDLQRLFQTSNSYWHVCVINAALELGVFTALGEKGLSAEEAALALKCDRRGTEALLNAISALGLAERREGHYTCTETSARFLSSASPLYIGHVFLHHAGLMERWSKLPEAVRLGKPVAVGSSRTDEIRRKNFLLAMHHLASHQAPRIAEILRLQGRKVLLDLGGGPGTYAIAFCQRNPGLRAVVFDLPTTREFAEEAIRKADLAGRVGFLPGDYETDELGGTYDAVWLSQVLHSLGPEACLALVRKAASALEPGGVLWVQEFLLDDSRDRPLHPALFSLNMLTGTEEGRSYSEGEVRALMEEAGLGDVRRLPFESPTGAGILEGHKA